MKCAFLSDLHIKYPGDDAEALFIQFCASKEVQSAEVVFILGDMFDLLIGDHTKYIQKYSIFFDSLKKLLLANKKVYYFEGNHDFQFEKTIRKFFDQEGINQSLFSYEKDGKVFDLNGKKYFICHGYEVDYHNIAFKRWYKIYSSKWFYFLITYIFTFNLLAYLGKKAAENSKKRGSKTFDKDKARKLYQNGAKDLLNEKKVDGIISGHTHIQEIKKFDDDTTYINCGFPLSDKNFLYYDENDFKFIALNSGS